MKISTIDKNKWYTMDIEKCEWSSDHIPVISFELNNLSDDTKYPIPNETGFNMSIEDAKQLHAWLGVVLNGG
jgi:hypothetical protein